MNGHIAKPIDVDHLVAALLRATSGGAVHEIEPERPRSWSATTDSTGAPLPASIPGIDLHATLPRFGGNFGNFVALFKRFERSQGTTLQEVRQLLRSGDRIAPIALMHRLRGVAANLGAADFAARALAFEHALRDAPGEQLVADLDLLEVELAQLMVAARELQLPEAPGTAAPPGADIRPLEEKLAHLLGLLQNNNLKALAEFDALRGQLAGIAAPEQAAALADAIATLGFATAARQLKDIMDRRVTQ